MEADSLIKSIESLMAMKVFIQVAIPSGYLGYLLSRCGISNDDKPITILFLSSVYALISVIGFHVASSYILVAIPIAVIAPLAGALLWRLYLHKNIMQLLHTWGVCNSTEFSLVWDDITQNTNVAMTQVTVYLKNGDALSCCNIYKFQEAPLRLFRSDRKGNVALYITEERKKGEPSFSSVKDDPIADLNSSPFYYRLTFIPKEEIERIEFVTNKPIVS